MRARYTIYVLLAALLWSTGGLGVKSVEMNALALAGFRSLFAVPVLVIASIVESRRRDIVIAPMLKRPLVWCAAFSYAVMVTSFVVAAKLTTAANAILLQYSGPIYVALLSYPLLRERIRRIDVIATIGCFLGMILFFVDRVSAEGRLGDLAAIVSSFGFAGVPLLMRLEQKKRGDDWTGNAASPFVAMTIGNLVTCVVCAPNMFHAVRSSTQTMNAWAVIAFLGIVQIGIAYWLYGAAVGKLPALRSSLLATIEPILNPLWVLLVRGEKPSKWAAIGGAVILVSVTMQASYAKIARSESRGQV